MKIEPMDERISVIFVHFLSLFFFTISVFLLLRNVSKAARTYKVKHNANNKAHQHHSYKIYNRFRKQPVSKLPEHLNIEVKHFRHVSSPTTEAEADTEGEPKTDSDEMPTPAPDDAALIHQEDTSGNTQVNVFAIQTDDETGGAWIQGGSGESLTEKLFGEYTPYNASGIASTDHCTGSGHFLNRMKRLQVPNRSAVQRRE